MSQCTTPASHKRDRPRRQPTATVPGRHSPRCGAPIWKIQVGNICRRSLRRSWVLHGVLVRQTACSTLDNYRGSRKGAKAPGSLKNIVLAKVAGVYLVSSYAGVNVFVSVNLSLILVYGICGYRPPDSRSDGILCFPKKLYAMPCWAMGIDHPSSYETL